MKKALIKEQEVRMSERYLSDTKKMVDEGWIYFWKKRGKTEQKVAQTIQASSSR